MSFDPYTPPDEFWVVATKTGANFWVTDEVARPLIAQIRSGARWIEFRDVTAGTVYLMADAIQDFHWSSRQIRDRKALGNAMLESENDSGEQEPWQA